MNKCPWTVRDVVVVFIYALALFFVFCFWLTFGYFLLAYFSGAQRQSLSIFAGFLARSREIYLVILFYCSLLIAMKFKIFDKYRIRLPDYFVRRGNVRQDILYGMKSYLRFISVFLSAVILIILAAKVWDMVFGGALYGSLSRFFTASEAENAVFQDRRIGGSAFLVIFMLGPFLEELFFRGCLYSALRGRMNFVPAMLISSFIFALLHGYFFLFFYVFLVGLSLARLYEKTQALVAPLSFHMLNNLVVLALFATGF
ncbi:MAG: CPBP family intramembrane glutamic endopeptidase [Candidatus Omnitrophota bacterium]